MIAKKCFALVTLGACVIGLSVLGGPKNPAERSLKGQGYAIVVVSLMDGSYVTRELGQATHTGNYTTEFVGYVNLESLEILSAKGSVTAANGDQMSCEMSNGVFSITGGTGRFQGATGSIAEMPTSDAEITVDTATMTMTITYTAKFEGTVSY
jgi:hypothetical protein